MRRLSDPSMLAIVALLALGVMSASLDAVACERGRTPACAVVLKMHPHQKAIVAHGSVSGTKPDYYFSFAAKAKQAITITTHGGGLKTGPGIPLTLPDGTGDAVDEGTPYRLTQSGTYIVLLHANTMSEGPFGRFTMKLAIQ